jgi:hypothetical protein
VILLLYVCIYFFNPFFSIIIYFRICSLPLEQKRNFSSQTSALELLKQIIICRKKGSRVIPRDNFTISDKKNTKY